MTLNKHGFDRDLYALVMESMSGEPTNGLSINQHRDKAARQAVERVREMGMTTDEGLNAISRCIRFLAAEEAQKVIDPPTNQATISYHGGRSTLKVGDDVIEQVTSPYPMPTDAATNLLRRSGWEPIKPWLFMGEQDVYYTVVRPS